MSNKNHVASDDAHPIVSRAVDLAHQLQDVLHALNENADLLAGDLFHHDLIFNGSDGVRLDEKLAEILAELKSLASIDTEG